MFASNSGPSYVSHQYLIAGQSANGRRGAEQSSLGLRCASGHDDDRAEQPGTRSARAVPVLQLSDARRPHGCQRRELGLLRAFDRATPQRLHLVGLRRHQAHPLRTGLENNVISPETTSSAISQNNNLRQVSYVVPDFTDSDHALSGSNTGPAWVSSIIDAVGSSQYWSNTAILVDVGRLGRMVRSRRAAAARREWA